MGPTSSSNRSYRLAKRLFDIGFSSTVLIMFSPILAVIAVLVRCSSAGPILFRQQRVGLNGRLFTIYKFRTMYVSTNPYAITPVSDDRDHRVTPIGRILRKTGLDEFPQFYNVLVGQMSVVGPRPEMEFLVNAYTPRQRRRLSVTPGITGPWQISEARREPIHENVQYDLYYIHHQSLLLDLEMIFKTFLIMLRPRTVNDASVPVVAPAVRVQAPHTVMARTEQQAIEIS